MKYICPACGFPELDEPPYDENGNGSYDICPSCGFEFGVTDDDKGYSVQAWRKKWVKEGMKWTHSDEDSLRVKPRNWNPKEQLKNIPKEYQ